MSKTVWRGQKMESALSVNDIVGEGRRRCGHWIGSMIPIRGFVQDSCQGRTIGLCFIIIGLEPKHHVGQAQRVESSRGSNSSLCQVWQIGVVELAAHGEPEQAQDDSKNSFHGKPHFGRR